jgi:lipoteichoic acid synthase
LPPMPDASPGDYARHAARALPHRLRPHGYRSALFHSGRFDFLGMRDVIGPMGFDLLADAATMRGERSTSFGIDEETTVDALLRWLGGLPPTQRALACWLPIAGHHPYSSPPGGPFPTDTQLGCYRNALHYADRMLARLCAGMCALAPSENWLLVVVGDHGQAFGEQPGNFGHAFGVYDENLRVPLVFCAPGAIAPGLVHDAPCSHLEVVPTLLDLLGIDVEGALRADPGADHCVHAFTDWGDLQVAARTARWQLVHDLASSRDKLFDRVVAGGGANDVAAMHPDVVVRLRAQALCWLAAARAGPRP